MAIPTSSTHDLNRDGGPYGVLTDRQGNSFTVYSRYAGGKDTGLTYRYRGLSGIPSTHSLIFAYGDDHRQYLQNGIGIDLPKDFSYDPVRGLVDNRIPPELPPDVIAARKLQQQALDDKVRGFPPGTIVTGAYLDAALRLGIPLFQRSDGNWQIASEQGVAPPPAPSSTPEAESDVQGCDDCGSNGARTGGPTDIPPPTDGGGLTHPNDIIFGRTDVPGSAPPININDQLGPAIAQEKTPWEVFLAYSILGIPLWVLLVALALYLTQRG